jgi:hypothetical protein
MPTIRCEVHRYGAAESFEGSIVPTLKDVSGGINTPLTGASNVVFGPATDAVTVVAHAIGAQAYVALVDGAGVATAANGKWLPDGGFALFELAAGQSVAAITAELS